MQPQALHTHLQDAPRWAGTVGGGGKVLILAAIALFAAAVLAATFAGRSARGLAWAKAGFVGGTLALFGAFACLATLFLTDQFQFQYIFERSERSLHVAYKIASVWSGQQGSFLLWACTSALFGLLALRGLGRYQRWYIAPYALILGALAAILAYESPFNLMQQTLVEGRWIIPPNGNGMTPSLQNYWVVIHPPVIFLGFGSLTVLFCLALSAMLGGDVKEWANVARPWALVSLAILALGICMGGFWAYETLGWGGFWAWDPVENASFVPWLFLAAFVHGIIVQVTRGRWVWANLLFGGLPFLWFLYGTWLTRSGMLSEASVHSFAEMDRGAHLILLGTVIVSTVAFLSLWAFRGFKLARATAAPAPPDDGIHRESAYAGGVMLLSLLGVAIGVGMSVPFFMAIAGRDSKVVEESLYHMVVPWFFMPIMVLLAIGPFLGWRAMGFKGLLSRMANVLSVSVGLLGFCVFVFKLPEWGGIAARGATVAMPFNRVLPLFPWVMALLFVCLLAVVANVWRIAEMWKRGRSSIGAFTAHIGIAVLMAGLILSRGFERKERVFIQPGTPAVALGYVIQFQKSTSEDIFDRSNKVLFDVQGPDGKFTARPGLYLVRGQGDLNTMVWPHVEHGLTHDVYFTLYEPVLDAWDKPESIKLGESKTFNNITIRYVEPVREGEPGQPGTKFGARLEIKTLDGTYQATPKMALTGEGTELEPARVPGFMVSFQGMDVGTGAVTVQPHYFPPIYPVELFYKPMTLLVWVGTGILFVGGLFAAYARRRPVLAPAEVAGQEPDGAADVLEEDALVPVA